VSRAYVVRNFIENEFPKFLFALKGLERIIVEFKLAARFYLKVLIVDFIADTLEHLASRKFNEGLKVYLFVFDRLKFFVRDQLRIKFIRRFGNIFYQSPSVNRDGFFIQHSSVVFEGFFDTIWVFVLLKLINLIL